MGRFQRAGMRWGVSHGKFTGNLSLGCTPGKREGEQEGADGPSELLQGGSLTTPSPKAGLFNIVLDHTLRTIAPDV